MKRYRYQSMDHGLVIVLEVPEPPMGSESGYIPPPVIDFHRNEAPVRFVYVGDDEQ